MSIIGVNEWQNYPKIIFLNSYKYLYFKNSFRLSFIGSQGNILSLNRLLFRINLIFKKINEKFKELFLVIEEGIYT